MNDELKPGTEEFAHRLTELTTIELLFAYKQHEIDFSKDSVGIAILNEAKRRDADRQCLAARITELEAQLTRAGWKLATAEDMLERIREKLRDMPQTFDDLDRHLYGDK